MPSMCMHRHTYASTYTHIYVMLSVLDFHSYFVQALVSEFHTFEAKKFYFWLLLYLYTMEKVKSL